MNWLKERVWQMGIGGLLVLLGALAAYWAAASEPVKAGLMWAGLISIFVGLAIPLVIRFFETLQEEKGEEGET
jgi:quinol-cytochrome oxidoreductase complex cytochrome b subunit